MFDQDETENSKSVKTAEHQKILKYKQKNPKTSHQTQSELFKHKEKLDMEPKMKLQSFYGRRKRQQGAPFGP